MKSTALILLLLGITNISNATECSVESSRNTLPVIELYTSEGCNSCPPADAWLNKLPSSVREDVVLPLAFHVDYWDYLGWKDPFAKPEYSQRQKYLAQQNNANYTYTPEVLINGIEFRKWRDASQVEKTIDSIVGRTSPIQLNLNLKTLDDGRLEILAKVTPLKLINSNLNLFIVIYENGLSSNVKAGENSGLKLKHDFVVRELHGPFDASFEHFYKKIISEQNWSKRNLGIAAFVQEKNGTSILQAVNLANCK